MHFCMVTENEVNSNKFKDSGLRIIQKALDKLKKNIFRKERTIHYE